MPISTALPHEPEHFAFVLVPGFTMVPLSAAIEPLRLANLHSSHTLYSWSTHSIDGAPVSASNDLAVAAGGGALNTVPPKATIVVCGGVDIENRVNDRLLKWLRKSSRMGHTIGALCTGSHILAVAGLLDDYICTIHWRHIPGFMEAFPDIEVTDSMFEIDRNRFTCAGGTASIDMMLALIARQHGPELVVKIADAILHSPIRHHTDHQRMSLPARIGVRHPKLIRVIEIMQANLEDPLSPGQLAEEVALSTRQLERLFRHYLERSPKRYYLELRLEKARSLLLQTPMTIIDIALACGFSSSSYFSKCYRLSYGRSPYRERAVPDDPTDTLQEIPA